MGVLFFSIIPRFPYFFSFGLLDGTIPKKRVCEAWLGLRGDVGVFGATYQKEREGVHTSFSLLIEVRVLQGKERGERQRE